MQITFQTRKRNTEFYFWRQRVPEGLILFKKVSVYIVFSLYWNKSSKVLYFLLCVHLFESNSCVTTGHYCGICDMLKWNFSVEILASNCLC